MVGTEIMLAIPIEHIATINNPTATKKVLFILCYPLSVFSLLI